MSGEGVPLATYRLQLTPSFGFDRAAEAASYLARLGVSHLYASPYLQAAPGSTHGYDVVDHLRVNEELGGAEGHVRLCRELARLGLGQVLDVVPNHMAISGRGNALWWDVLENGPSSRYACFFDVDWDPPESKLRNTVLLPVLGDHYGRVLEAGELRLSREGGSFLISYYEHRMPVAPGSRSGLLAQAAERARSDALAFIAESFARLPLSTARDRESIRRRHRDKEVLRLLLDRLLREDRAAREAVDAVIAEVNRDHDRLEDLLDRQNYRLAYWRTAGRELDYRRFFDINSLAALRTEDEQVFQHIHSLVLEWTAAGLLQGLRIDHPDGLRDPEEYFRRLRERAPEAWIVAEKILGPGERLPASWPVAGTTGYDFIGLAGGLFVDRSAEEEMTRIYRSFTGVAACYCEVVREKKLLVLERVLASDVNRLASLLVQICEKRRRWRDYTRHEIREVLREAIASFPVYRSYVRAEAGRVTEGDARRIRASLDDARSRRPDLDPLLFDFLRGILLLELRGETESELVMRFQQLTGPTMAKGAEDTAFYCYNRLVSLNEVGWDPGRFGIPLEEFHRWCAETAARWPGTLLAGSTHDTKRSEDVRARLHLLSEIPQRWEAAVERWSRLNERRKKGGFPDRNAEYLLYQTLVGAWPIGADRAAAYMEKASREAKAHTSWTDPSPEYDEALRSFVEGILADEEFTADLAAFVEPLVEPGRINSLSATLLRLTAPGVPDIYQGTELWDLSLVDPDNRRPVDLDLRRRLLAEVEEMSPEDAWARIEEGLPKLLLFQRVLAVRARRHAAFAPGASYRALEASGPRAKHLAAFVRGEEAVTLAPRLVMGLSASGWGETTIDLGRGSFLSPLTGDRVPGGRQRVSELLRRFPVGLLLRET